MIARTVGKARALPVWLLPNGMWFQVELSACQWAAWVDLWFLLPISPLRLSQKCWDLPRIHGVHPPPGFRHLNSCLPGLSSF